MTHSQSQIKDLLLKLFRRFNAIQPPVNQRAPNEAASWFLLDSVEENTDRETDRQADRVVGRGWWWWGRPAETYKPVQKGRKESPGFHRAPFKGAP